VQSNRFTTFKIEKRKISDCVSEIIAQQLTATYYNSVAYKSNACVRGFSNTIVPIYQTQYVSHNKLEPTVPCFVCNSITVFRFDLLHGRNCAKNIECIFCAKYFNLWSLSLLTNFQNFCCLKSSHWTLLARRSSSGFQPECCDTLARVPFTIIMVPRANAFFNISFKKAIFKLSWNHKANCYGISPVCRKLYLSTLRCRKPIKVGLGQFGAAA